MAQLTTKGIAKIIQKRINDYDKSYASPRTDRDTKNELIAKIDALVDLAKEMGFVTEFLDNTKCYSVVYNPEGAETMRTFS